MNKESTVPASEQLHDLDTIARRLGRCAGWSLAASLATTRWAVSSASATANTWRGTSASIDLSGHYTSASFHISAGTGGTVEIVDPPVAKQQPEFSVPPLLGYLENVADTSWMIVDDINAPEKPRRMHWRMSRRLRGRDLFASQNC